MMLTIFLVLLAIGLLGGRVATRAVANARAAHAIKSEDAKNLERYGVTTKEVEGLTTASRKLLELRAALPPESRPQGNFAGMLRALDIKYGPTDVNDHFNYDDEYDRRVCGGKSGHPSLIKYRANFSLDNCSCPGSYYSMLRKAPPCQLVEYKEIRDALEAIRKAHEEQEHAIKMAAVAGELESVSLTIEAMREEAQLINSITKEIAP